MCNGPMAPAEDIIQFLIINSQIYGLSVAKCNNLLINKPTKPKIVKTVFSFRFGTRKTAAVIVFSTKSAASPSFSRCSPFIHPPSLRSS